MRVFTFLSEQQMQQHALYHPVSIGPLSLKGNVFFAPVAGYSDSAFRSIAIEWEASFTYTEMVSSEAMVRDSLNTKRLIRRASNETHYAIQIFGSNPAVMAETAKLIVDSAQPSYIDINAGCPMPKITKTGAGAALTREPTRLYEVVKAVADAVYAQDARIPVTVKIRAGWEEAHLTWKEAARAAVDAGAQALALHPRTCAQCYAGEANWDIIADLVQCARGWGEVPVFGSGDLHAPEDARAMLEHTACAGVMFARGAMGNPFIFRQTRQLLTEGYYTPVTFEQKLRAAWRELHLLAQDVGESSACKQMRKRFVSYAKGERGKTQWCQRAVHASSFADFAAVIRDACPCIGL